MIHSFSWQKILTIYHHAGKIMIIFLLPGNQGLISEDKLRSATVHVRDAADSCPPPPLSPELVSKICCIASRGRGRLLEDEVC